MKTAVINLTLFLIVSGIIMLKNGITIKLLMLTFGLFIFGVIISIIDIKYSIKEDNNGM